MRFFGKFILSLSVAFLSFSPIAGAGEGLVERDGLPNFCHKLQTGRSVKLVYLGGSITSARDGWRELSYNWLRVRYPEVSISHINAGIGGTGSVLGVFRTDKDVVAYKPDLVFVEFAVNDGGRKEDDEIRTVEGIVRKIWSALPETDICFVYTTDDGKFRQYLEGKTDSALSAMEMVADHYGIPSIHFAPRLAALYREGKLIFTGDPAQNRDRIVFTSDHVHPLSESGHPLYAASVAEGLECMASQGERKPHQLSSPLRDDNWQAATLLALSETRMEGWELVKAGPLYETYHSFMPMVYKGVPGSRITFSFKGTAVGLYDFLGPKSPKLKVTIDGVCHNVLRFDRHCSYLRRANMMLAENLDDTVHQVCIEVTDEPFDKSSILYSEHLKKYQENPASFSGVEYYLGYILLVGNPVPEDLFEAQSILETGDEAWRTGNLSVAKHCYESILAGEGLNEPCLQNSVRLRLARLLLQEGDTALALDALDSLNAPALYQTLMADDIRSAIDGSPESFRTQYSSPGTQAATLFVLQGFKDGDGSREAPFGDIETAVRYAGRLCAEGELDAGAIRILLLDSKYSISGPVILDCSCSGTLANPICISSAAGSRRTVITGEMPLTAWRIETDPAVLSNLPEGSKGKVWTMEMPPLDTLVFGGFGSGRSHSGTYRFDTMPVPELFYEGKVQVMSRWPNLRDTVASINRFRAERVNRWGQESDVWLHGYWKKLYADSYEKLGEVEDGRMRLSPPYNRYGFGDASAGFITESRWYALNVLSEMDRVGEWKYSSADHRLWFYAPSPFRQDRCLMSMAGPGFLLDGCDNLVFENLEFAYLRGDGLIARNCNNLSFFQCQIHDLSGLGIQVLGGSGHIFHSLVIHDMGRGGIYLQSGDKLTLEPSGCVVENCHIYNLSRIDRTYTPAILLDGAGIKVQHCKFESIPSSAIRLEGNDMLIQLNEFSHCVQESNDQGAIDIWFNSFYRGNIIRWNYFHDIGSPERMAGAVRMDDAISGVAVVENIMQRSSTDIFGAVQVHGGNYNYIEGNLFLDNKQAVSQTPWPDAYWDRHWHNSNTLKALASRDLGSARWKKYPELIFHLYDSPNRNFVNDNQFINCPTIFLKNSNTPTNNDIDRMVLFNNCEKKKTVKRLSAMASIMDPWHKIPLQDIGLY